MSRNHYLAKSIVDAGWTMFINQLLYKAESADTIVQKISNLYPSSKLCSECGNREEMPLRKRIFKCGKCENVKDRDHNSAKNILNEALRVHNTVGNTGINACGDVQIRTSEKQEAVGF